MAMHLGTTRLSVLGKMIQKTKYLNQCIDKIGSIDRLRELAQAEKEGQLVFITEKMALAMIAGARAIEKNKRLQGVIYNYDVFGKLGAPKEISYFEAAKVLREAAEAALKEREAEHDKHTPDKV